MDDLARKRAALMSGTGDLRGVEEVADKIYRIGLSGDYSGLGRAVNCYLFDGSAPALVNAGHPAQRAELMEGLTAIGVDRERIDRVIATSWRADVLGGANAFAGADLFVCSPDMRQPRDYGRYIDERREGWEAMVEQLGDHEEAFESAAAAEAIDTYYDGSLRREWRVIPLDNGHRIRAGEYAFEVMRCGGPGPGHMALYDAEEELLMSGDLVMSGLPDRLEDTQAYLVSMERIAELSSKWVLPNEGRCYRQGRWTVSRAANFINNFLNNAPSALVRRPTVAEFVARDQGIDASDSVNMLKACRRMERLLQELVRSRSVAAEGQGLERRYGIDVDDPRAEARQTPD